MYLVVIMKCICIWLEGMPKETYLRLLDWMLTWFPKYTKYIMLKTSLYTKCKNITIKLNVDFAAKESKKKKKLFKRYM